MSRLKQNRIIDSAIVSVVAITKNQCSLSEHDLLVAEEAVQRLQMLKRKKGKTNEQIQKEIAAIVLLLISIFAKPKVDEINKLNQ